METYYRISLHGTPGAAYASYKDGTLQLYINELQGGGAHTLIPCIPTLELQLKALTGPVVQELKPRTAAEKIALFVMVYQQLKGTVYRATKEERANITQVTVTKELLNTYLKASTFPLAGLKSISDYIRHYNEVRDLARNGQPVRRSEFPDAYDREFEKRLGEDPARLQRYWAHLRQLGWKKEDGVWKNY